MLSAKPFLLRHITLVAPYVAITLPECHECNVTLGHIWVRYSNIWSLTYQERSSVTLSVCCRMSCNVTSHRQTFQEYWKKTLMQRLEITSRQHWRHNVVALFCSNIDLTWLNVINCHTSQRNWHKVPWGAISIPLYKHGDIELRIIYVDFLTKTSLFLYK